MTSARTKIKVVMLIGQLDLGGSERQLYLLLKNLDASLFDCSVIVLNPATQTTLNNALEKVGIEVVTLPAGCRGIWRRMPIILRALRERSPDVVHSWSVHDNPYAGLMGLLAGVPVRLGSLRDSLFTPEVQNLPSPVRWLSLHSCTGLVVNSRTIVDELVRSGFPERRVHLMVNGVEIPEGSEETLDLPALGVGKSHRLVAVVGNLRSKKNHLMFIEGMARVLPGFPDVRALIVGDSSSSEPDLPGSLDARIRELGLSDRITLGGFCADVPALMNRLSVFCLTSTFEGMPNVVLEAMAASRPVVSTRVGGVVELIEDRVNGLLVESGDVAGFARAVEFLLRNPETGARMGRAGREMAEGKFSCRHAARQFEELYRRSLIPEAQPAVGKSVQS